MCYEDEGIIHPVSESIVSMYSPMESMVYTYLITFLVINLIGYLIFICNIVFKNKSIGMILGMFIAVIDFTLHISGLDILSWIYPASWINIDRLKRAGYENLPSLTFAITTLLVINILIVIGIYIIAGKKDVKIGGRMDV